MQAALAQKGTHVSLRTVYRTMSEAGLIHRHRRPHGITKADTETQNRDNLIKRNFSADKPLKKLLTAAGTCTFVVSLLYIVMMFAVPVINSKAE